MAWTLYGEDNLRYPNNFAYTYDPPTRNQPTWAPGGMAYEFILASYFFAEDATNTILLLDRHLSQLAPYTKTAVIYKCPADKSYAIRPISGGPKIPRARSYSLNRFVGEGNRSDPLIKSAYRGFYSPQDFAVASPSQIFVFLDEHEDSIDDGWFFTAETGEGWDSVPANHHGRGDVISFADAHVERRRWMDDRTVYPITRNYLAGTYQAGQSRLPLVSPIRHSP